MKANLFDSKIDVKNISHAYLFESTDSINSHKLINYFVKAILCNSKNENFIACDKCKSCHTFDSASNPDFLEIYPDDKEKIGIGTIRGDDDKNRGIINILNETSLISSAKVIKLNRADLLNEEAQNYLLKILEEPPPNSHIIMMTSRPYRLKKTILSRLVRINIQNSSSNNEINEKKLNPMLINALSDEFDISSLSGEELKKLEILYEDTMESLEKFNFTKNRVFETWNDDYLHLRLNILKQNIFLTLYNSLNEENYKDQMIISTLSEEELFLFLEEVITFQGMMANKVPINKKIQLDSIFDFIR